MIIQNSLILIVGYIFLYSEECDRSSLIREDERLVNNNLKEVEKIVDYVKK